MRLQNELNDVRAERDRWHQAFLRESELRAEETGQLRQLLQQEQALAFSRLAAIGATTLPDASVVEPQEVKMASASATSSREPSVTRPWWRRLFGLT
jgi:hypothetical protein